MEQGLYEKVLIIYRKYLDNKKEKENTERYIFQGKSARSMRWFNHDYEWLEESLSTFELDFYKKTLSNEY